MAGLKAVPKKEFELTTLQVFFEIFPNVPVALEKNPDFIVFFFRQPPRQTCWSTPGRCTHQSPCPLPICQLPSSTSAAYQNPGQPARGPPRPNQILYIADLLRFITELPSVQ